MPFENPRKRKYNIAGINCLYRYCKKCKINGAMAFGSKSLINFVDLFKFSRQNSVDINNQKSYMSPIAAEIPQFGCFVFVNLSLYV